MGEAERQLVQGWTELLESAEDPVEVWYEHIWAPDIDHRAIEGAPDDIGPINGRDAMRSYLSAGMRPSSSSRPCPRRSSRWGRAGW